MNHSDRQALSEYREALRTTEELYEMADTPSFREVAKAALDQMNAILVYIAGSQNPRLAVWQVCYGMSMPMCEGMSVVERAQLLGFTRAALSKGAKDFQRAMGLPPNEYMRDSVAACAAARERQLSQSDDEPRERKRHRLMSELPV